MQKVFIINPVAGRTDASAVLPEKIRAAAAALGQESPVIEITQYPGHAKELSARYAATGEPVQLFACGGDGTLNEVLQSAVGQPQMAVGCLPCGSGNDYVRNFGTAADFLDLKAQLTATTISVDAIQTADSYGVDICAAGLDAQIAYGIPKFRRLPFCGGTTAYTLSILQSVFSNFEHHLRITLDGKVLEGVFMLLAICNGRLYGGGYCAAPNAMMDDGLLDVILVKPVPRYKLPGLLGLYKKGLHLDRDDIVLEKMRPYIQFFRVSQVAVDVLDERPFVMTLDGECALCRTLQVGISPKQLRILLPSGLSPRTVSQRQYAVRR